MIELTPTTQRFILHWGEMGTRWGINRTVAQTHALLYLAEKPLCAEVITNALQVARSNVSTSLKELQGWGIVKVVHVMGDRRDHFESMTDVWEMFEIILQERRRREIDPTMQVLRECVAEAGSEEKATRQRLEAMLGFFETMTTWHEDMCRLPKAVLLKVVRLGAGIRRLVKVS